MPIIKLNKVYFAYKMDRYNNIIGMVNTVVILVI